MKRLLPLLLLISIFQTVGFSMPYHGKIQRFQQPDGSFVDVKLFGTEYYMRAEGLDGYSLIRDKKTKWICYALLSSDQKELLSSGIVYRGVDSDPSTLKSDLSIPRHLEILETEREKIIQENTKKLNENSTHSIQNPPKTLGTPIHPVSGTIKGLCLVIDFSDEPATVPISEFEAFCNGLNYSGYGNNGSLRKYYRDISGGVLDYENVVYGYFRAPLTFAAYDSMPYATGAKKVLSQALNWVKDQGFDFSTLTLNPDSTIMAINMMYTGNPPVWAQGMWHHKGYYSQFSWNGIRSGDYNCSPANGPLGLSIICHENGHMIGKWPDTYKYTSTNGLDGIGAFDLMCAFGSAFNPPPPNPLFRSNAGWEKVIDITNFNGIISDTANDNQCFKYQNWNDTSEFYLIENCRKTGRSQHIPGEGLAIWHMDRNGNNQTTHHEVYLVHANNDIMTHANACFRGGYKPEFSETTTPKSDFYSSVPSNLRVWEISPKNQIMTYKVGAGQSAATFRLNFLGISGDNNGNGFAEPGESANFNIQVSNLGQMQSGLAKLTAKTVGANSGLISVSSDTILVGTVQVNQLVSSNFNFIVQSSAPVGAEVTIQFFVSDGISSFKLNQKIVIGSTIIMSNGSFTTCYGIFMDNGGTKKYSNNTEFVKTIFPDQSSQKVKIKFLEFDVENKPNCGSDFLEIYDGPSISSPNLGIFCGSNLPEEITSTHSTGALTFYFHSDAATTRSGWKALISCFSPVSITQKANSDFKIVPNPTNGRINLNLPNLNEAIVIIQDVLGKEIYNQNFSNIRDQIVDLLNQPEGVYLLSIQTSSGIENHKILIQR